MSKIATVGKRVHKADGWHDDNGPIAGFPDEWDPPMTDEEVHAAALADPDCPPMTDAQLARFKRVPRATVIRRKLGLSREEFARRYRIPIDTLRAWERHEAEPDATALAFLQAIEREPEVVARALAPEAA